MSAPVTHAQISRFAFPAARVDEALLFAASPLPDDSYSLTWLDGRSSRLARRAWDSRSPVQAGYALHLGRQQARIVRELGWLPAADRVEILEVAITHAARRHPASVLRWWRLGLYGAVAS